MGQRQRLLAKRFLRLLLGGRGSVLPVLMAGLGLAAGPAAAAPVPTTSAEFTVPSSSGYALHVKLERHVVEVIASADRPPIATISTVGRVLPGNEDDVAATTYWAPAAGTPEHPEADLGPFGHVDVAFQPSGETRVSHLSQKGKTTDCVFPRRIVRRLGTFTGTISFRGEHGYTEVEATSAEGSLGTSPFRNCSTVVSAPRPGIVSGQAGPDAYLDASSEAAHLYFSASTLGLGSGFYTSSTEALSGGIAVVRTAQARASWALAVDAAKHEARLRPPAPFSGEATFRRGASRPWRGSLAVAFPGLTVPLTGPSFEARLRLAK